MGRYIDADKVMEEINRIGGHYLCEWDTLGVRALIDRQPTADVVPRAEVLAVLEELDWSAKYFEIPDGCAVVSLRKLEELKKKYEE